MITWNSSNKKILSIICLLRLRKQELTYAEIGRMIGRDQRNVRTMAVNAEKKIE